MSQSDFVSRGQTLVTAGQYQEAVKVCRLGLLGRPTTVEGRIVLGQALLALKRYDEVLAEMRVALELDHSSIPAQVLKAEALLLKGDNGAAGELLGKLRTLAPTDPQIARLATAAEQPSLRPSQRPVASSSHAAIGYVGGSVEVGTKNYPGHQADEEDTGDDDDEETDDSAVEYTRPTSVSAPHAKARTNPQAERTPNAMVLAVGDRSGTVEVDPPDEGDTEREDAFDVLASPPSSSRGAAKKIQDVRGSVQRSTKKAPLPKPKGTSKDNVKKDKNNDTSSVELDSDDVEMEMAAPPPPRRPEEPPRKAGGTAVRNAVNVAPGPFAEAPSARRPTQLEAKAQLLGRQQMALEPTARAPEHLAQLLAANAQSVHMTQTGTPQPLPPAPNPRSLIASAQPTRAAMPMPPPPPHLAPPPVSPVAHMPTLALSLPHPGAIEVDAANQFAAEHAMDEAPAWVNQTMVPNNAQHHARSLNVATPDPNVSTGPFGNEVSTSGDVISLGEPPPLMVGRGPRTGIRRVRSKFQLVVWVVIGTLVIGGGVFAGFQIRAMRLTKQIDAAHEHADDLAKPDTWGGWIGARDSLAGIAQAASTVDNRATLARARALIAYEFIDGIAEAKAAVDALGTPTTLDGMLASAYLALAQNDAKAASAAAKEALALAPTDAAAQYVSGEAEVLGGDLKGGIATLRGAVDREPRPLYYLGLARAQAQAAQWDEALATLGPALKLTPEHPGLLLMRGYVQAAGSQLASGKEGTEVREALAQIVAEGGRPFAEQPHGVAPAQVELGNLALARVDYMLGNAAKASADWHAGLAVGLDDQRVAEEVVETLFAIGQLDTAHDAADRALASWPASRVARTTLAQIAIALGKPTDALDLLAKSADALTSPKTLAVRAQAKAATGDLDGARADFDTVLKSAPGLELAIVGRAWVRLAAHEVDEAKKLVEPRYKAKTASTAMTTVYAAILRASNDPGARDKAKAMLEAVTQSAASGYDMGRAQLELARIYRDTDDPHDARLAYEKAMAVGNLDARLEVGLLMIDDLDPKGGRDTIDQLLKDVGDHPSPRLLLEGARARMLTGDHVGAEALLQLADKATGTLKWQLRRERARLAFRKNDVAYAAKAVAEALADCGDDSETFLLAADVVYIDLQNKEGKYTALETQLDTLAKLRLKGKPEADIVAGKLALAADQNDEAEGHYLAADTAYGDKAVGRRRAQAKFGLGVIAFNRNDVARARGLLKIAISLDPTLYDAYLFDAELAKAKKPHEALVQAQEAVKMNPELLEGWVMVGQLGDQKLLVDALTTLNNLAPSSPQYQTLEALRRR